MKRIKTAAISFFIVILIFILVNGLSICLSKMENTISPVPYKVFYLEENKSNRLSVTLLNNKFILDFNRFFDFGKQNERYNAFIPPSLRLILSGIKTATNTVSTVVCEVIKGQNFNIQ